MHLVCHGPHGPFLLCSSRCNIIIERLSRIWRKGSSIWFQSLVFGCCESGFCAIILLSTARETMTELLRRKYAIVNGSVCGIGAELNIQEFELCSVKMADMTLFPCWKLMLYCFEGGNILLLKLIFIYQVLCCGRLSPYQSSTTSLF